MQIQFLGAADAVTGSRHLVTLGDQRILLDCGLFQGFKVLRERNWAPLGVAPHTIDAVVLSHAHLDHSGWLPGLVKAGFRGPIYASPATCDLAAVLLLDSAHLQEEDARRANRQGFSRHAKALPLYTKADARKAIAKFVPLAPGKPRLIGDVQVLLTPVGHLLGACAVTLSHGGRTLGFSGDVGRDDDLLMPAPQALGAVDVLLVESTYGNRHHPPAEDVPLQLAQTVRATVARGGSVLLPTFAVGRAQALLAVLQRLKRAGEIPAHLPIFLDSPMAIEATTLYTRHRRLLRLPAREVAQLCDHRRPGAGPSEGDAARPAPPGGVRRLPGRRQPRRTPGRRRAGGQDPRRLCAGARGHPADGGLLRPCRCRRADGLAAAAAAAAGADLRRARRARRGRCAAQPHPGPAGLARAGAAAPGNRPARMSGRAAPAARCVAAHEHDR